ncbi:hypothetical protein [Natrinema salaciae]|nr:hypothetical protein [Natrinema salaciae]
MIETLPDDVVYYAGVATVSLLVLGRLYVGEHYFNDRARFWGPLRRYAIPILHRLFQRHDEDLYAETEIGTNQVVDIVDDPPETVLEDLANAGYEPQPLASFARDWLGRPEVASWARYEGPAPFHGAPHFLRPRQVHVRLFETDEGTMITAHEEATPWRPDQWRDHYRGETMDVETGVVMVAFDLELDHLLEELADPIEV